MDSFRAQGEGGRGRVSSSCVGGSRKSRVSYELRWAHCKQEESEQLGPALFINQGFLLPLGTRGSGAVVSGQRACSPPGGRMGGTFSFFVLGVVGIYRQRGLFSLCFTLHIRWYIPLNCSVLIN